MHTDLFTYISVYHRVHVLIEMKKGESFLSWSAHCDFVRDGNYSDRSRRAPSTLTSLGKFFIIMECTVRQKAAVATLCVL